jgi:hypothetical protein
MPISDIDEYLIPQKDITFKPKTRTQGTQCFIEDPETEFGKPIFRKLLED